VFRFAAPVGEDALPGVFHQSEILERRELLAVVPGFTECARPASRAHHGVSAMKRATVLRREMSAATRIPYRLHVSPHLLKTEGGEYVQVFKVAGCSFETVDDVVLNNWHERLNILWRNIASANTALWVHVIRRREQVGPSVQTSGGFADSLAARYSKRPSSDTL